MSLPIEPPVLPMLAATSETIPVGDWLYEPKWDGFRAICFKDGDQIHIGSRNSRPLQRYFPELCATLQTSLPDRCVVDGEIVIEGSRGLDFDALLLRIHPAASRVNMLAEQSPSTFVGFDILALGDDDVTQLPLSKRRTLLKKTLKKNDHAFLTPQTADREIGESWFHGFEGAGLDGLIAKPKDIKYLPGQRAMVKIKHMRTADCVVGGYRLSKSGDGIGSLLLGVYNEDGLHYIGHTSSFKAKERIQILALLKTMKTQESFGFGRVPGGISRWTQAESVEWTPIDPTLVCEVAFDHLQGYRFRHGTRFLRWRPDKDPRQCTWDQLEPPRPFVLEDIRKLTK